MPLELVVIVLVALVAPAGLVVLVVVVSRCRRSESGSDGRRVVELAG